MTIAIDIRNLRDQYGGIPEYTRNAVRHLIQQGTNHHFVLFYNGVHDPYFQYPKADNVTVVTTRWPNKLFNPSLLLLRQPKLDELIAKRAGRPIDLFFATDHNFFAFGKKAAKKIMVVHDLGYHLFPYYVSIKGRIWIKRVNPFKLFKTFDHIIAVSQATKNDLMRYTNMPEEKISVVHQGIDDIFFKQQDDREESIIKGDYIPLIGQSGLRKNANVILHAFHDAMKKEPSLNQYKLVIAGERRKNRDIEKSASALNLNKHIVWLGHVTNEEKINLYKHARCIIYPSFYEGFGLPPLEAMALGTPVITAANSALTEVSGSASLLINAHRPETIREALICLHKNDTVRAKLIVQGRALSKGFSWDNQANRLLEVFERVSK